MTVCPACGRSLEAHELRLSPGVTDTGGDYILHYDVFCATIDGNVLTTTTAPGGWYTLADVERVLASLAAFLDDDGEPIRPTPADQGSLPL